MSLKHIILMILICVLLGSCSAHFYKMEGNEVAIYLKNPEAETAQFMCSLDGYVGRELKQLNKLWVVTLPADKPFRYFYKVDGELFLPPCPLKEKDDFGSENCIFEPYL